MLHPLYLDYLSCYRKPLHIESVAVAVHELKPLAVPIPLSSFVFPVEDAYIRRGRAGGRELFGLAQAWIA